jgi:CO/xanthine dehydrogenase FAD-binding subunit
VRALAEHPGATVLAGGTDLMVEVNDGRRSPERIVAVGRIPELGGVRVDDAFIEIGAATTFAQLELDPVPQFAPALAYAARTVGSPQIRNAATIGGNLATCSPAGDGLPVLAAVEATVELSGPDGVRTLPVAAFMTGVKRTDRRPGELLTAVTVPILDGWQGYAKVGVRNAMVIAIAGACLAVDRPTRSVRIALGSVAPTIVRAPRRSPRRPSTGTPARSTTTRSPASVRSSPTPAARSTTTGPAPPTAGAPSRSSPAASCAGRSLPHERAVPLARQRHRPPGGRRLAR